MKLQILFQRLICIIVLILVFSSCSSPAPTASIKTAEGDLVIKDIQLTDRFPPGCTSDIPGCSLAEPGHQVLLIWLELKDASDPSAFSMSDLSEGAYVTASDGSRAESFSTGWTRDEGQFVAFAITSTAGEITLHWPGNPPISLEK